MEVTKHNITSQSDSRLFIDLEVQVKFVQMKKSKCSVYIKLNHIQNV